MTQTHRPWVRVGSSHLAAWLLLVAGTALTGLAVLAPTWLQTARLQDQLTTLAAHKAAMEQQLDRCRQVEAALNDRDPALIERLVCQQFTLTPRGTSLVLDLPEPQADPARLADPQAPTPPPPTVGRSLLTTLTHGPSRLALALVGLLFSAAGLMMPVDRPAEPVV